MTGIGSTIRNQGTSFLHNIVSPEIDSDREILLAQH